MIFNIRTFNRIDPSLELNASALEQNIDIVCMQEHKYHYSEIKIKYHDTGIRWTFISASAQKNSVSAAVEGVGMLLSPHALKSLNSIEKIQPRMMVAIFNSNPSTMIISCYSPTNASDEKDPDTFYNELSSLVYSIPKHNILIFKGDMNA